jgi:exodeoxyribonuclease VII large subunit
LHDGLELICRGGVEVYAPRGSYQLIVRHVEPRGLGALELALRQLRAKLEAEGLFDPQLKKSLPTYPRRIAFVTSPTGAAIRDFLEVLRRRWTDVQVLIIPTRVQGEGAAKEIARGITTANRLKNPPDVLVVGRGGGSLEDLWCFNEEEVVRAIHASRIPVVSAVGHEIDVTLSDLVADLRALTPSEAAERIVPSMEEVTANLTAIERRLLMSVRGRTEVLRMRLNSAASHPIFRRPHQLIHQLWQQLDEIERRSLRATEHRLALEAERVSRLSGKLESLSPLQVLKRGYSLTERASDGNLIVDADSLDSGDLIRTRFAAGTAISRVEETES